MLGKLARKNIMGGRQREMPKIEVVHDGDSLNDEMTYLAQAAALSPWVKFGRRQRELSLCKMKENGSLI